MGSVCSKKSGATDTVRTPALEEAALIERKDPHPNNQNPFDNEISPGNQHNDVTNPPGGGKQSDDVTPSLDQKDYAKLGQHDHVGEEQEEEEKENDHVGRQKRRSSNPFDEEEEEEEVYAPAQKSVPMVTISKAEPEEPQDTTDHLDWLPSDDESVEAPKLGSLQLSVQHSTMTEELVVRIKKARNLWKQGVSIDPYVKVSLFPDPTKKYNFKTEVKTGTADPVFDETLTFPKVTESDLARKVLKIVVHNEFEPVSSYIGEINIKLGKLGIDLAFPKWVPLRKIPDENDKHTAGPQIQIRISEDSIGAGPSVIKKAIDNDAHSVAPSLISAMSSASMATVVKVHEYGKVHLSLQYKYSKQTLQIIVIAARLNKLPGSSGLLNPYAKLYLVPDPTKKSKQKTKPQKNTLDPIFNETFEFKLDNKDIAEKKIQVSLWDHDMMGRNAFCGETLVRLSTLPPNEVVNKWYPLESLSHGELLCQLAYDSASDYLNIKIMKARDLLPTRAGALVDPYVKIYLLPDKRKQTKKKSHYRKQTLSPDFNETITYFLAEVENAKGRMLHVSVLDHASVGGNELIGAFSIPVNDIVEAGKEERWFNLIKDKMSMDLL